MQLASEASSIATPMRIGTREPSFRSISFSQGVAAPVRWSSATAMRSRSAYSGGVSVSQRNAPERSSSREYPIMSR